MGRRPVCKDHVPLSLQDAFEGAAWSIEGGYGYTRKVYNPPDRTEGEIALGDAIIECRAKFKTQESQLCGRGERRNCSDDTLAVSQELNVKGELPMDEGTTFVALIVGWGLILPAVGASTALGYFKGWPLLSTVWFGAVIGVFVNALALEALPPATAKMVFSSYAAALGFILIAGASYKALRAKSGNRGL